VAAILRRAPGIEEAPLSGEVMLFDPSVGRFFVLNRTMSFIWKHCDGISDARSMLDDLVTSFRGAEPGRTETDLREALTELKKLGLLLEAESPEAISREERAR